MELHPLNERVRRQNREIRGRERLHRKTDSDRFEADQGILVSTWVPEPMKDFGNPGILFGVESRFHLHGLHGEELLTLGDFVSRLDGDIDDEAGHRRRDLQRVAEIGLDTTGLGRFQFPIDDADFARWPLSLSKTERRPSGCGSPTVWNLTIRVLPGSISMESSSPGSCP